MAIMVRKLYKNATFLYGMNLVAGKGGMSNLVEWVHIIEDEAVSGFLHGGELVFTAGIMNNGDDWLLRFAQKLMASGVSAFVVNLGPYTQEIPPELAAYCDEVNLPLFTIPWETRMVDMTRDFCHRIMQNEHAEQTIASIIKNILFKMGDMEAQALQLERYGYQRGSRFCFVCVGAEGEGWQEMELSRIAEAAARRLHELFVSFSYKETRILVLVNYEVEEIDAFLQDFLALAKADLPHLTLRVGVSSNQEGIYDQSSNFERSLSAMQMAKRRGETVVYYDRLGFLKLLCAVEDKSVLRSFYQETVGTLEKYDRENKTELMGLLRAYQALNGNLVQIAQARYVHRNTVTNQLRKIKLVTGLDPLEQVDVLMLMTGLMIRELL
jgi:PucR family transcriptional regulator, proline-responsive transcriptional activator